LPRKLTGRLCPTATLAALLAAAPQATAAQQADWHGLPRMELETTFAGPLRDTIVQRLRDPNDGTVCYIYLPITAPHTPPAQNGYVQYGPNAIGSLSCVPGTAAAQRSGQPPMPSPRPAD
jgi:hypothetical protein